MHQFDNRYVFLTHCNVCSIVMYSIISINIDPILAFRTGPRILPVGASAKRLRSTVCSRARCGGVLRAKQSRSMACSGAGGDDVLRVKWSRLRAKRSSGIKGVLHRR
jgi:hypothetical protein